jgi:hypothetical protein
MCGEALPLMGRSCNDRVAMTSLNLEQALKHMHLADSEGAPVIP